MPINLKTEKDQDLPSTNIMGMYPIDVTPKDLSNTSRLLELVARQTKKAKEERLALFLNVSPWVLGRIPFLLKVFLVRPLYWKCYATAVLSNLGPAFNSSKFEKNESGYTSVNGLVLEKLELLPPFRPDTNIALGVVTYAHHMYISCHYDPKTLTQDETKKLLDIYYNHLKGTLDFTL